MNINLVEGFESQIIEGVIGAPDRVVETVVSKLFFYGDVVYKVYKYRKEFFGDFSDKEFRHEFYHNDFIWNNTMAPDIYTNLVYVKKVDGIFRRTDHDSAEDYYLEMRRIDDSKTLFNLLKNKEVSRADIEKVAQAMLTRLDKLTEIKRSDLKDLFDIPYTQLDLDYMETLKGWMKLTPKLISDAECDCFIDTMKAYIKRSKAHANFDPKNYIASIDNHAGNILFIDGVPSFIDSMPPMRIWRIQTPTYSISRPATDVEVLMGKEYADAMYEVLEAHKGIKVEGAMRSYLQLIGALIEGPYMSMLNMPELAEKYMTFAREKLKEIQ